MKVFSTSKYVVGQVYGPEGLGKLSAGGHPRHLLQADLVQPKVQTGVNDAPILDQLPVDPAQNKQQGGQQAAGQQHPADLTQTKQQGGVDQQQLPTDLVQNKQQGGIGQEQLSQAQRSQEQHTQQQVKEQFSEGAQGSGGAAQAQAESAEKADCFASFNPPTVKEYQEVCPALKQCSSHAVPKSFSCCDCVLTSCSVQRLRCYMIDPGSLVCNVA